MPLVSGDLGDADEDPVTGAELEPIGTLDYEVGHPRIEYCIS